MLQHPFSEDNFAELLYAVQLLKSGREEVKDEYMLVVVSYFDQFTKLINDEETTITTKVLYKHIHVHVTICVWHYISFNAVHLFANSCLGMYWTLWTVSRSGRARSSSCTLHGT